jgi:hypothetical protein
LHELEGASSNVIVMGVPLAAAAMIAPTTSSLLLPCSATSFTAAMREPIGTVAAGELASSTDASTTCPSRCIKPMPSERRPPKHTASVLVPSAPVGDPDELSAPARDPDEPSPALASASVPSPATASGIVGVVLPHRLRRGLEKVVQHRPTEQGQGEGW